ncbi:hypothetical protein EON83_26845 [bacterium]|nr:MAG: hypothetical protein EON83_26845 [bacterium]
MSYPKRAPNLRIITVQDMKFRWCFSQKERNSTLACYGETSYRNPLIVTCLEYQDSWTLFSLDKTKQVTTIGPKFVSEVIGWALANGWVPTASGPPMQVDYEAGNFSLHPNGLLENTITSV